MCLGVKRTCVCGKVVLILLSLVLHPLMFNVTLILMVILFLTRLYIFLLLELSPLQLMFNRNYFDLFAAR